MNNPIDKSYLLINSSVGRYMPQWFGSVARGFRTSNYIELEKELQYLEEHEPEDDYYWENWETVLDNFTVYPTEYNNTTYKLVLDEDLWLVPENEIENWEKI